MKTFCIPAHTYIRGEVNTTTCPANGNRILTEESCQLAAQELGGDYRYSGTWDYTPKGCYAYTDGINFYLNEHASGAAKSDVHPICARSG